MDLSKLLDGVSVAKMFQTMYGKMVVTHEIKVGRVRYDSRSINRGDMFVAIKGYGIDGHNYISDAVNRGCNVVVVEDDAALPDSFFMHAGVAKVVVSDSRKALARIAANYYGHPAGKLRIVGVTGTNGKTTTTYLIQSILQNAGLIGTIEYRIGDRILQATHTTPESVELNELFDQMVKENCTSAAMEVSSHALHQSRVDGIRFSAAVFTNLTQDHLDYHGTMEAYFETKKQLFDGLAPDAIAVTNIDDPYGERIVSNTRGRVITYATDCSADFKADEICLTTTGTRFSVLYAGGKITVESQLIGRFNVYNTLAAFATGIGLGVDQEHLKRSIARMPHVPGRFESITSQRGWTAIIDYAHTPDALEKCLAAVHDIFDDHGSKRGRIITVFGCGGDRDRTKRPKMGEIAARLSDLVIVTSDNPRSENPSSIIDEIITGISSESPVHRIVERGEAIRYAAKLARPGDVVLVAGKGHERYQIIESEMREFSDRDVVLDSMKSLA